MLKTLAKKCLPVSTRQWLRTCHRKWTFARGLKCLARLDPRAEIPANLLQELVYGWDNSGWSAWPEFLAHTLRSARELDGPILECGSGLSTLLLGTTTASQGRRLWSLEHHAAWHESTRAALAQYAIGNVELLLTPLREFTEAPFGTFAWYDAPLNQLPTGIALVVCDGPPSESLGGRIGLLPVVRKHLRSGCRILLDDLQRREEQQILQIWASELGTTAQIIGREKPFGLLVVP